MIERGRIRRMGKVLSGLLAGLTLAVWSFAVQAAPSNTATVNFSPTPGSYFTFQYEQESDCSSYPSVDCVLTDLSWTDPAGYSWDESDVTGFTASFSGGVLDYWFLSVKGCLVEDCSRYIYSRAETIGDGFQTALDCEEEERGPEDCNEYTVEGFSWRAAPAPPVWALVLVGLASLVAVRGRRGTRKAFAA